ncbi:BnaC09g53610D [Brassica napus]|uniref:(rape) hypothetical protein n=1 Tax=Brassica napus TaxID=3708 RepID=A0A078IJ05_BRANA|nr:unnamed protein product [Brassica napus]CDY49394.1 BnaC09g53610D [Brassica napus]
MAQSPDGCTVASAAGDQTLRFWDVFGMPETAKKRDHKGRHDPFPHVIGPYRSGKSFLLNQLLSLSCYEGVLLISNTLDSAFSYNIVGKSNVYDDRYAYCLLSGYLDILFDFALWIFNQIVYADVFFFRIFALATVMSSVLIYNLPETVS